MQAELVKKSLDLKKKFEIDFKKSLEHEKNTKNKNEILFLCVGTDKVLGDSFGPLVGTKLEEDFKNKNYSNINVLGTLENNVNFLNIQNTLKNINEQVMVVVIDAALSNKENVGKIFVSNKKTILGNGLSKEKFKIGDISIKTVVAKNYKIPLYNFKALQNISLGKLIYLADVVADGIIEVINYY